MKQWKISLTAILKIKAAILKMKKKNSRQLESIS